MKWSAFRSPLLVATVAAALAGCASNAVTPTPPGQTTDTFTGTLTTGSSLPSPGGLPLVFTAKAGQVDVKLTTVSPDGTLKFNMYVGVYNVYYGSCTPTVSNDTVGVGGTLSGLATATTTLCISITDPNVIPAGVSESITITATHY